MVKAKGQIVTAFNQAQLHEDLYMGEEILTGALDESERSDLCPNRFRPGEGAQGTKRIRDWAVPTTSVDFLEKENIFGTCREINTKVLAVQP